MIDKREFDDYCRHKRIAIVGNSSGLLSREDGKFIDSHDVVVRMNRGYPCPQYHKNIGKRTDIWSAAMGQQDIQLEYHILFDDRTYTLWPWPSLKYMICELEPTTFQIPKKIFMHIWNRLGVSPSTGCSIVFYYVTEINYTSLTITGFDFFKSPNFFKNRRNVCKHNPDKEETFLRDLIRNAGSVRWIR